MLACFEHWFGPYPWYADGYKLVEAPHLGMEHQSAVAYGNHYQNGYLGRDLSRHRARARAGISSSCTRARTSGSATASRRRTSPTCGCTRASPTTPRRCTTECKHGKEAGARYVIGVRENVKNDAPIVAQYGVNREGSGDMYYKGGNMLHTIRQLVERR